MKQPSHNRFKHIRLALLSGMHVHSLVIKPERVRTGHSALGGKSLVSPAATTDWLRPKVFVWLE